MRLRAIGATDEEVDAMRTAWIEHPPAADEVEWARHVSDAELVHELRKTRVEFDEHTTLDGDEPEAGGAPAEGTSPSSPDERIKAAVDAGETLEAQRLVLEQIEQSGGSQAPDSSTEPVPVDAGAFAAAVAAAAPEGAEPTEPDTEHAVEPEPLPDDVVRVDDVIEWVGGDVVRARTALDAEQQRSTQRSTLVETLEAMLNAAAD